MKTRAEAVDWITLRMLRGGLDFIKDAWTPYRGVYPDPTPMEYNLIFMFLCKFALEYDDFDDEEESDQQWILFKQHHPYPNLRSLLLKFFTQVRRSKGYDVDLYFDFSVVPAWRGYNIFVPHSLTDKNFRDTAMAASKFAVREINTLMRGKRNYMLVSVEKLVSTTTGILHPINILLLTFTANEIFTSKLETLQAMLVYDAPSTFQLKEWKFKPIPI